MFEETIEWLMLKPVPSRERIHPLAFKQNVSWWTETPTEERLD